VRTIINCAGDDSLAVRVRDFVSKSKWVRFATFSVNSDEVMIEDGFGVKTKDVRRLLEAFIASNNDLDKYSIIEINGVFTIGIVQPIVKLLRHACEMCGCITATEVELIDHRQTHFAHF
jgi:hypothetical protein